MRPINTVVSIKYNSGRRSITKYTITYGELRLLADSIVSQIDRESVSSINKAMTKGQSYDIMISPFLDDKEYLDDEHLLYSHFYNVVREFVLNQKTLTERYKKVNIVMEKSDWREVRIGKLLDEE